MDLKHIPTDEIIQELESREGIEKTSVGLYAPYELKRKYYVRDSESSNQSPINADVLIIRTITK